MKLEFAHLLEEIVATVGQELLDMQRADLRKREKAPGEWVTAADTKSHELLVRLIEEHFPGVPIVMEEQTNASEVPATCIVADELDGTHIYMNGLDEWGIALAFIDNGRPVAGVLAQPATGTSVWTERGCGAWSDGQRLKLDDKSTVADRIIGAEINRHLRQEELAWLRNLAGEFACVRTLATAIGNALELLRGQTALFVNVRGGKIWDFAAAALAVKEAGGVALSPGGKPLNWSSVDMGVVFATNASTAELALSLLADTTRHSK